MKTKTSEQTQPTPGEIAKQIADKAGAELAQIAEQLQTLEQRSTQLTTEREQIVVEHAQRADHLLSLRNNVTSLEAVHKDAELYANVAHGTAGEAVTIQQLAEAEKRLVPARHDLDVYTEQYAALDQGATARLAEIDTELQQIAIEQSAAITRRADVDQVSTRAVREVGESTYADLMKEHQEHQAQIDELNQQIVKLKVEKSNFLEQAKETLASWPDLQTKLRREEPFEDATSRIIAAAHDYVERLLEDGPNITRNMPVPAANSASYNWLELLEVPRTELFVVETLGNPNKRLLPRRLTVLNNLLNQYIASKR